MLNWLKKQNTAVLWLLTLSTVFLGTGATVAFCSKSFFTHLATSLGCEDFMPAINFIVVLVAFLFLSFCFVVAFVISIVAIYGKKVVK